MVSLLRRFAAGLGRQADTPPRRAVDWQWAFAVNGETVVEHSGGFDPISVDITDKLKREGMNVLTCAVNDPTDKGPSPRQTGDPAGWNLLHPHHWHLANRLARSGT